MVQDLNHPIKIEIAPTIRESDGLAMSSRNSYLSTKERKESMLLYLALKKAKELIINKGMRRSAAIISQAKKIFTNHPGVRLEYLEVVDPVNLSSIAVIKGKVLIAVAALVGKARLIDNMLIRLA